MTPTLQLSPVQTRLLRWASQMSFWIADVTDLSRPILGSEGQLEKRTKLVLWQLTASCHSTSESALLLIGNGRLWDADILVRSVVEGTLKFVFLTIGDHVDRAQKLKEFDDDLSELGRLRRHKRLEEFLAVVENPDADEWRPFREMLLTPEAVAQLQRDYPRKNRQLIEQKWSFAEICRAIKRSNVRGIDLLGHLLFNYGMSSHVSHQDIDGIGMVWDRNGRSVRRREAVEFAHGARLVGDISIMAWLRTFALFELTGTEKTPLKALNEKLTEFHEEAAEAQRHFHDVEYETERRTAKETSQGT